jgi:hypothetical protein
MSDAGLLISTRQRVVWTRDERKLIDRVAKVFNAHGDKLKFVCGNITCPEPSIVLQRDDSAPGGRVLRCGCRDRVFTRSA